MYAFVSTKDYVIVIKIML